jgi:glycine oxidase
MKVLVKGAGVAGLAVAHELARRAAAVAVVDTRRRMDETASWVAGGMLAPCCESETAGEAVLDLGRGAADWWERTLPGSVARKGTLVVSPGRDSGELDRFAGRARGAGRLGKEALAALEPDLASRFPRALFFESEAHLDPRRLLPRLERALSRMGVAFRRPAEAVGARYDVVIDCTGSARIGCDPALRGVRGEVLLLRSSEIRLSRPVRLLHPRFPV